MDFQCDPVLVPIRVLMINPLSPASQLTLTKMLSGSVFGRKHLIDLTLLVYSNEIPAAEDLKMDVYRCGFPCMNSITVSSDVPRFSDADVFCFLTNFYNPNSVNFDDIDEDQFDVLYLLIKIGNSLSFEPPPAPDETSLGKPKKVTDTDEIKPYKPIIMADGVITMNILKYVTKNIPTDIFFCPTPLPVIAKNVLADQIKVAPCDLNEIYVWGANEEVFHIEVDQPMVINDTISIKSKCDWDMIPINRIKTAGLDPTQFNETWMKKDFIEKVTATALKNPYGHIYRASIISKTLNIIWKSRDAKDEGMKVYASLGVISDGSLGTLKGFGYVLPLVLSGDSWAVNTKYKESSHVVQEILRINKSVKNQKEKLVPYCKRFLEENVKNQAFIASVDSESTFS